MRFLKITIESKDIESSEIEEHLACVRSWTLGKITVYHLGCLLKHCFKKNQDKWINSNTTSFPPIHCVLMPQNSLSSLYPLLFHPPGLFLLHLYFFPSIKLYVAQSPLSGRLFLIKHEVPCGPSNLLSLQVVIWAPYAVKLLNLTLIPLISLWFPWQQAFYHLLSYTPIVSYIMSTQRKKIAVLQWAYIS